LPLGVLGVLGWALGLAMRETQKSLAVGETHGQSWDGEGDIAGWQDLQHLCWWFQQGPITTKSSSRSAKNPSWLVVWNMF